jgi:hypothetical protein
MSRVGKSAPLCPVSPVRRRRDLEESEIYVSVARYENAGGDGAVMSASECSESIAYHRIPPVHYF